MAIVAQPQAEVRLATDMLIGGKAIQGDGDPITVINPSSGLETLRFPGASLEQFRQAISVARATFDRGEWAGLRAAERATILQRFVEILAQRRKEISALIVTETGCPVGSFAMGAQIDGAFRQARSLLDLYLKLPEIEENPLTLDERVNPLGGFLQSIRRYVPVGVVAAISAYNFPFNMALLKTIPSLAAGNCVILRPSPLTPLSALYLADAATEAGIPAGVLGILAEAGSEGAQRMTSDPAVDMVSFTGSSAIGSAVAVQAAPSMKRLQLELGGKSAQIFLPDRVEAASNAALSVCISHAGQGCVLGTRIFVPETEKPRVLAAMKISLDYAKIGDSADPATTMGPVISEAQVQRCKKYVRLAIEAGATIVAGGKRADRPGFYFEPTVLDVPDNKNPAAQEEIFGPVVCVIGYRDIDHAVEMANDSSLGLSGFVHGRDSRQALDVARRIRTGTINVNAFMSSANASSGGHKMSGIGRQRGVEGIRAFQEIQVMNLGTAI